MKLWSWLLALFLSLTVNAGNWEEGKHFKIANPAGKSAEPTVVEVFSYGCPVCYRMEAAVAEWLKTKPSNIKFVRIPHYGVHDDGGWLIKMFYTAEALGIVEKMHAPLFEHLHTQHRHINNENEAVSFLLQFGHSEKVVREAMNGFAVDTKVRLAQSFVQKFRLSSVPAFVINDKYYTDGQLGREKLFEILNDLALR
jgi:thiol:disulfide interchange protein DsbA